MSRIPSLDGLRAFSISLVVIGHLFNRYAARGPHPTIAAIFGNGGLGVEVFFVISGYLITSILLREFEKLDTISLPKFYFRRSMRIFPAFYAYLIGAFVLGKLFFTAPSWKDLAAAAVYSLNYLSAHRFWSLEHTWSLAVEEQFYILWPTLLLFCLRRGGKRSAQVLAGGLFVIAPALRLLSQHAGSHQLYFMLHTREDALMAGCFAALSIGTGWVERWFARLSAWWPIAALYTLVASPILATRFGGAYVYTIGMSMECLCITLCMLTFIRKPASVAGVVLNFRPIAHIGVLSYSIYLWQELFLHSRNVTFSSRLPFCLLFILAAAESSYWAVERPFLQWRERIEARSKARRATGVDGQKSLSSRARTASESA